MPAPNSCFTSVSEISFYIVTYSMKYELLMCVLLFSLLLSMFPFTCVKAQRALVHVYESVDV